MEEHVNVLITERDEEVGKEIEQSLRSMGHACTLCNDLEVSLDHAASGQFEVVIAGLSFDENGGWRILQTALKAMPESQVVLLGEGDDVGEAVKAMSSGAANYLHKPVNLSELSIVISRLVENVSLIRDRKSVV